MKIFKLLLISLGLIAFASCTNVSSTNVPGKKLSSFPKKMNGDFELILPEDFASIFGGEDVKTYVSFKGTKMTLNNIEGETVTELGDSLYVSSIGKSYYLSMGEAPNYTVFKVVIAGKDLQLFPMYVDQGVTKEQLVPYFEKVEEIMGEPAEDQTEGDISFSVTIKDDKLEDYFKSDLPLKDFYLLKRTKK